MTTPSLPAPVAEALRAANAGDTDAYLATFTEDGAVDDWGRLFRGRDAIRGWSDAEFIGKQVTLEVTATRTDGPTTVVSAQVGGNGFNGPSDFAFTVEGDGIALMRITG
jgi:uncharacterized protein (TIGR02246 family)